MTDGLVSKEKLVDAWLQQSALMWRSVYSVPVVAIAVFAGWYALDQKSQLLLSIAVLLSGVLIMLIQWAIIRRMAEYLNALRDAVDDGLPSTPKPILGLAGYRIASSIPLILTGLFLIMIGVTLF